MITQYTQSYTSATLRCISSTTLAFGILGFRLCQLCEGNIRTVPTIKCDGQHHLGIVGIPQKSCRWHCHMSWMSRLVNVKSAISLGWPQQQVMRPAQRPLVLTAVSVQLHLFRFLKTTKKCPFTAPYLFTLFNQGCHRWQQRLLRHSPNGEPEVKTQKYVETQGTCDICLFFSLSLLFNSDTSEALVK